jgi:hypothetical protein
LDLKLGIKPKAGNFLSGNRVREGGRERKRDIERLKQNEEDKSQTKMKI